MAFKETPTLESITVRGKYTVFTKTFEEIAETIRKSLSNWNVNQQMGDSIALIAIETYSLVVEGTKSNMAKVWHKKISNSRHGIPMFFSCVAIEHLKDSILVEVECRPNIWYRISTLQEKEFPHNSVEEALIECRNLVKSVMSGLNSKEVEPISVYPIIQRTEIKNRLSNLGLKECVEHLDKAERHIVQNNFEESLKSSRTAFEKVVDWEVSKRRLEKTNNYKNDLERLQSKGFIDPLTTELIQTYYRCLSNIAVHSKGEVSPGFHEAQMGYGITLIMLQYFADKLP
jgi:hypothetical protein